LLVLGAAAMSAPAMAGTAHDFSFPALEGGELRLAEFRGKVLLVVNTASFCGYTPQFRGLQALHDRFFPRGFAVIGVPSNDFNQEAADASKVREVCDAVEVDFPLAAIGRVRGAGAYPFFAWAGSQSVPTAWNFRKYLVGADGRLVRDFPTRVVPDAPELIQAIEAALPAAEAYQAARRSGSAYPSHRACSASSVVMP
jgi:glutathione peroxidase